MNRIKVILVDDHDLLLDGLGAILRENPEIEVSAKASSVDLAEKYIRALDPDVVITDITMGAKSGQDLTRWIRANFPGIRVIVLSMHDEHSYISNLLQEGASGYLLKNVRSEELYKAISLVSKGETYIQESLSKSYHKAMAEGSKRQKQLLSARELEILKLIASENTTPEIAVILNLSVLTVETHRKNMLRKIGSKSMVGLLAYARDNQLI